MPMRMILCLDRWAICGWPDGGGGMCNREEGKSAKEEREEERADNRSTDSLRRATL